MIDCHHNYVAEEVRYVEKVLVTCKAAVRAGEREWGHHSGRHVRAEFSRARSLQS